MNKVIILELVIFLKALLFKELTAHICPQNPRLEHAQGVGGRFVLATLFFKVLKLLSQGNRN